MPITDDDDRRRELRNELLGLMMRHQAQLLAYIYTLVPNWDDAEDILSEASVVMLEKFEQFTPGTDFLAWANKVAYWSAREFRTRCGRSKVLFDDATMELVADRIAEVTPKLARQQAALQDCLERLSAEDRAFIMTRYEADGGVAEAANRSGRKMAAAYKALTRIRQALHKCVTQRLQIAEEE